MYICHWREWTCKFLHVCLVPYALSPPAAIKPNSVDGTMLPLDGHLGYLLLKTLHFTRVMLGISMCCCPACSTGNNVILAALSLQWEFSTDFYTSAATLFPIPKTAPSKLIPVSVWSPLPWWLSLRGQLNKSPTVSFHWRNSFSQIWIVCPWSTLSFMDGQLKINRIQRLSDFPNVNLSCPAAMGWDEPATFPLRGEHLSMCLVSLHFFFISIIT